VALPTRIVAPRETAPDLEPVVAEAPAPRVKKPREKRRWPKPEEQRPQTEASRAEYVARVVAGEHRIDVARDLGVRKFLAMRWMQSHAKTEARAATIGDAKTFSAKACAEALSRARSGQAIIAIERELGMNRDHIRRWIRELDDGTLATTLARFEAGEAVNAIASSSGTVARTVYHRVDVANHARAAGLLVTPAGVAVTSAPASMLDLARLLERAAAQGHAPTDRLRETVVHELARIGLAQHPTGPTRV
jgi:DNA-directed RNA polymerase subunit N (RpoN/RPB10)